MRSLARRFLALFARRSAEPRLPGLHVNISCDTSQAVEALAQLEARIRETAALADREQVSCDLSLTIRSEIGGRR